ncbi:MAG: ABC transporter permease [Sciscionella sp.]
MKTGYLVLETKRALRSPRALMFIVAMPVLYFFIFQGLYGGQQINNSGVTYTAYLMCSMAAFGAFMATVFTGSRTAVERSVGWQRQLRLTPLSPLGYLAAKATVGMLVALVPVILVSLAGALIDGVSLSPAAWLQVVLGVWVAALPFAALGLLIGQLATAETMQIYSVVTMLLCGFLGGLWIPVTLFPTWLASISKILPSYWLAEVGHGALLGNHDIGTAVLVLAAWTLVLGAAVMARYRRDSARV